MISIVFEWETPLQNIKRWKISDGVDTSDVMANWAASLIEEVLYEYILCYKIYVIRDLWEPYYRFPKIWQPH